MELPKVKEDVKDRLLSGNNPRGILAITAIQGLGGIAVLHQLDKKIIYHYDFKHLTEKYFEIGMKLNDFSIQLVKYCIGKTTLAIVLAMMKRFKNVIQTEYSGFL